MSGNTDLECKSMLSAYGMTFIEKVHNWKRTEFGRIFIFLLNQILIDLLGYQQLFMFEFLSFLDDKFVTFVILSSS